MVRMLKILIRFILASRNLGVLSACKIFYFKLLGTGRDVVFLNTLFGNIHWNTKIDWVITHFYTPQIEIISPNNDDISISHIVDLGANIGTEILRFSRLYPNSSILGIEAEPRNFAFLRKNTKDKGNVTILNAAIWDARVPLNFVGNNDDSQSWQLVPAEEKHDYDIIGMPFVEILRSFEIDSIDILKVDIEGAEVELFKNCDEWIHKVSCIIMECPDSDKSFATQLIFDKLTACDFKFNTYINGENLVLVRSDRDWVPNSIELY